MQRRVTLVCVIALVGGVGPAVIDCGGDASGTSGGIANEAGDAATDEAESTASGDSGGGTIGCRDPGPTGGIGGTSGVLLTATYDGQIQATWQNQGDKTFFLSGCGSVQSLRCKGTGWTEQNVFTACDSVAVEVRAGATFTETLAAAQSGSYYVTGPYGLGCSPGKSLYTAGCASFLSVNSTVFTVPGPDGSDGVGDR